MGLYGVTISPTGITYKTMDTANPKTCTLGQREWAKEDHSNLDHFFSSMALGMPMPVGRSTVKPDLPQDNANTSKIGTSVWLITVVSTGIDSVDGMCTAAHSFPLKHPICHCLKDKFIFIATYLLGNTIGYIYGQH